MKTILTSVLSFLPLALTAPIAAQADVRAHGHGSFVASNQETHVLTFAAVGNADGTARGFLVAREPSTGGFVCVVIETWASVGDVVAFEGTVVLAHDAPFATGGNVFFAVRDGEPDGFAGVGRVPPPFAPMTAAQILALIGPPPPAAFSPLLTGDIAVD